MVNSVMSASGPVAVIDLGSNSILLLVLGRGDRVLRDEARITRLGQGVFESGVLAPRALAGTRRVLREFAGIARELGARRLVGVGTEALRRARDGERLLSELCSEGLLDEAYLLSEQQEAELAIAASRRTHAAGRSPLVVVDVGGGSTELAWEDAEGRVRAASLPLGSVRLTEAHVRSHPIGPREMADLRDAVGRTSAGLESERARNLRGDVIAVAGTATTLAALELRLDPYDPEAVEGLSLSRETVSRWIADLSQLSVEDRRRLPGLEPGRADVIVAGLVVLEGVLTRLSAERFRVSGRGVRYGVAFRLLEADSPV
jgi:exopolyphosphatase/guanosine-5'-triphosphate,3'-diphosphate pyrophosphatase